MAFFSFFLDLPTPVRQRIYAYLLAPHPEEEETVINYTLKWNWLENPSNTTFGGIPQIDLCRCPRQTPRVKNVKTRDHIYTRYKCYGPEVKFKSGRDDVWVPSLGYGNSGQINFLRPAKKDELDRRPNANILGTCKQVYEEALPILYRGRNFLFVTGPCPRGRYQAYAALRFFARLSTIARVHVTALSLNVVPHEEDCSIEDVGRAYGDLVAWVQHNLSSFETLGISLWNPRLASTLKPFEDLLRKGGARIELDRGERDGWIEEIEDVESFRASLLADSHEKKYSHVGPVWEELQPETMLGSEKKIAVTPKPEGLLGKWRAKEKAKSELASEEDGGDWSDTLFTPASSTKDKSDAEGWEVI